MAKEREVLVFCVQSSDNLCSNLIYFRHQCNINVRNAVWSQSGLSYHISKSNVVEKGYENSGRLHTHPHTLLSSQTVLQGQTLKAPYPV